MLAREAVCSITWYSELAETGDLSASGCFILSCSRPEVGDTLWLSLQLTKTTWLHLRGTVIESVWAAGLTARLEQQPLTDE